MRIEINAGGISGAITVLQFQAAASKHLEKSNDVISAFVTVQRKPHRLRDRRRGCRKHRLHLMNEYKSRRIERRRSIVSSRALRIFFHIRWIQMREFQIVFHRMQRSFIR